MRRKLQIVNIEQVHISLLSQIEPNNLDESKTDEHWVTDTEEELN